MTSKNTMIQHQIATVLRDRFHVSDTVLAPENWDKPLTGRLFSFSATDLVYLLFELEIAFVVRFPKQYLDSYGFCSINRIAEAIRGCEGQS